MFEEELSDYNDTWYGLGGTVSCCKAVPTDLFQPKVTSADKACLKTGKGYGILFTPEATCGDGKDETRVKDDDTTKSKSYAFPQAEDDILDLVPFYTARPPLKKVVSGKENDQGTLESYFLMKKVTLMQPPDTSFEGHYTAVSPVPNLDSGDYVLYPKFACSSWINIDGTDRWGVQDKDDKKKVRLYKNRQRVVREGSYFQYNVSCKPPMEEEEQVSLDASTGNTPTVDPVGDTTTPAGTADPANSSTGFAGAPDPPEGGAPVPL
jgi:hypothetical protein